MKERPILMSAPMVRALLAGTKTQTRRLVKSEHVEDAAIWAHHKDDVWESGIATGALGSFGHGEYVRCPYGAAGDRLWCRETWAPRDARATAERDRAHVFYRADDETSYATDGRWRPGIHMPRWACRLVIEVSGVRVQRLQAITEEDARAEGVTPFFTRFPHIGRDQRICGAEFARDAEHRASLACLWDEINGDRAPWGTDPWVWVVAFRRLDADARAA